MSGTVRLCVSTLCLPDVITCDEISHPFSLHICILGGSNTEDLRMNLSNSLCMTFIVRLRSHSVSFIVHLRRSHSVSFIVHLKRSHSVSLIVHLRFYSVFFIVHLRFHSVTSASTELLEEVALERCTGAERTTQEECKFLSRLTEGMDAEKLKD